MDREARALVVDASAAVGLLAEELSAKKLAHILRGRARAGSRLLVPTLFWLEVVNALTEKYRGRPDHVIEAIAELDAFGLETVELDWPTLLLTVDAVVRHGLTAYDASYLVLAESTDAQILTLDARLAAAVGDRAVRLGGGHSIGEVNLPYEAPAEQATWASWPGAAAYLRELRARIQPTTQ